MLYIVNHTVDEVRWILLDCNKAIMAFQRGSNNRAHLLRTLILKEIGAYPGDWR